MNDTWHAIVALFVFGTAFLLLASNTSAVSSLATTGVTTGQGITKIFQQFGTTKAAA